MRGALCWSCVFGVWIAYWIWTGVSFPKSGNFSVKILSKMFSMPLEWDFSPSSPVICWLGLFGGSVFLEIPMVTALAVSAIPSCLQTLLMIHCVAEIVHRVFHLTYWYFFISAIWDWFFLRFLSLLNLCFISYLHHLLYSVDLFDFVLH